MASASRPFFASPGVGDDFPDVGAEGALPDFSTAFAAVTFEPASAFVGVVSSFVVGETGFLGEAETEVGTPIDKTLAFGGAAAAA